MAYITKSSITDLYLNIAFSIDNLIGKNKVIDANFSGYVLNGSWPTSPMIFENIDLLRKMNKDTEDIYPYYKKTYIEKQVNALELQLKIFLAPEQYEGSYIDCLKILLDLEVPDPSVEEIASLKNEIDIILTKLGYKGKLIEKVAFWKEDNKCNLTEYVCEIKKYSQIYSNMTFEGLFNEVFEEDLINTLIRKNNVEYRTVNTDEGWSAYNYYKGNFSGVIVFNDKGAFHKNNIKTFVSHEAYPGHHTSGLIKEFQVNSMNDKYLGIQLLNTPACLIEEGIADTALQLLGSEPNGENEILEILLDDLNANVNYLISIKLFGKEIDEKKAFNLLKSEKLLNDMEAMRSLTFIKSWKYYVPTYKLGRDFLRTAFLKVKSRTDLIKLLYLCPNPSVIKSFYEQN